PRKFKVYRVAASMARRFRWRQKCAKKMVGLGQPARCRRPLDAPYIGWRYTGWRHRLASTVTVATTTTAAATISAATTAAASAPASASAFFARTGFIDGQRPALMLF